LTVSRADWFSRPDAFFEHFGGKHFRNPVLVEKTLRVLRDPTCSAQTLAALLEKEPGLSSKVLKTANSAFFGTPRTISSLKAAIVRVGNQNIARIALAAALTPTRSHLWVDFWRHSIAVSMLSRHIAQFLKIYNAVEQDEFLTMGLLHDVGALAMLLSGEYGAVDALLTQAPMVLEDAEREVFGFDHAELGRHIAETWNFPSDLVHAIAYHHRPEQSREFYHRVIVVHLADLTATGFRFGLNPRELPPPTGEVYLQDVHMPVEQLVLFGEWLMTRKHEIDAFGESMAG
jgi:putative nucleotidyltransferase with HDIG domain